MFELDCPWVLLFLPLPWLVWYLVPRANPSFPVAVRLPFFNALVKRVVPQNRPISQHKNTWLWFVIWTLVLCALAGPRYVGKPIPITHEGYNIMLALDLSGSMDLPDMMLHGRPVTRLNVVKRAAEQFVQERVGDKVGLILFGTRAYLQTPLTYDRQNVLMRIQDATVGLAGKTTSLGDALGLAVKRLQTVPKKGRVVILLTDGVNNSGVLAPLKAAEIARDDDIKVYTIGLGADVSPAAVRGVFLNAQMSADLDEQTLKDIAEMTGGQYFRATDAASLQQIYQTINQLEKISQKPQTLRPQKAYYVYPLAFALMLLFYWLLKQAGFFKPFSITRRGETK